MKTTMTPRERIELQVLIYKDVAKDNRRLLPAYENKNRMASRELCSNNGKSHGL